MGPEGLMRSSFCITSKHFREPFRICSCWATASQRKNRALRVWRVFETDEGICLVFFL